MPHHSNMTFNELLSMLTPLKAWSATLETRSRALKLDGPTLEKRECRNKPAAKVVGTLEHKEANSEVPFASLSGQ